MHVALWIVTWILAVIYLFGGAFKVVVPKPRIARAAPSARWVEDFSAGTVKLIGCCEVLGAIGLVLPGLTGIARFLVPIAAVGLALIMIGASITRVRRREHRFLLVDLAYLGLLVFVAVGRCVGETSFWA